MNTVYTTIENQIRSDGSRGLLYDHFDDYNAAMSKFFTICAAASISEVMFHEAILLSTESGVMERRAFDRRTEESGD